MIAQRCPDDDTPSGWAICWPLIIAFVGALGWACFCFVKAYGAQ
jgi:hypothetical protein